MKWSDYLGGNFLRPEDVDEDKGYVIKSIEDVGEDKNRRPRIEVEREGQEYSFDLNKTNAKRLKKGGKDDVEKKSPSKKPKDAIGKIVYFDIVKARNPQTKKEVDSLRIRRVAEKVEKEEDKE